MRGYATKSQHPRAVMDSSGEAPIGMGAGACWGMDGRRDEHRA